MTDTIIVAILSLVGTLVGAYFANKKTTALIVYRIDQLEEKVNKHNEVIERTYELEKNEELIERDIKAINSKIKDLESYHK